MPAITFSLTASNVKPSGANPLFFAALAAVVWTVLWFGLYAVD